MKKVRYLEQTDEGVFYFRRVIPAAARPNYGKTEERMSLWTKDRRVAEQKIKPLVIQVDERIKSARAKKCIDPNKLLALRYVGWWLDWEVHDWEDGFAHGPQPPFHDEDELDQSLDAYFAGEGIAVPEPVMQHVRKLARVEYTKHLLLQDVTRQLEQFEVPLPEMRFELRQRQQLSFASEYLPAEPKPFGTPEPIQETHDQSRALLSEVFAAYLDDVELLTGSRGEWQLAWRRFCEVVGDGPIGDLKPSHLRTWHNLMRRFPKSISNKHSEMPLRDIVEMCSRSGAAYETITPANLNKYYLAVKAVLNWAVGAHIEVAPIARIQSRSRKQQK
jgi:hypothetical protein